jgi:hypothetical protein
MTLIEITLTELPSSPRLAQPDFRKWLAVLAGSNWPYEICHVVFILGPVVEDGS